MTLGIGLYGAHRVGKTTLAKAYSEKHGIKLVQTTASATFARLGLSPSQKLAYEDRLTVQGEILKDFDAIYSAQEEPFIADRTPIDMIAYTMAEVLPTLVDHSQSERIKRYCDDCLRVLNRHFAVIIGVQPGIKLVEEPDKAAMHPAYMEHLNVLMLGLTVTEDVLCDHYFIPRRYLLLSERIAAMEWALGKSAERRIAITSHARNSDVTYH